MTWLDRLRIVLALAGMTFAVAGLITRNRMVIWAAIALLAGAFLVRLALRSHRHR